MAWFRGRLNRANYFALLGLVLALTALAVALGHRVMVFEFGLLMLAIPRLHDLGRSGWWAGGFVLLTFVAMVAARIILPPLTGQILGGLYVLLLVALAVVLGAMPGQAEANAYGEPPAPGLSLQALFGRS